jgi:alkaline phosphatase
MAEKIDMSGTIGRRDWLKAAALGGGAAAVGVSGAASAQPVAGGGPAPGKVRGVIFMVSDGMSAGVLTMAEALSQRARKSSTEWMNLLSAPAANHGLMDTGSADSMVTDSAAAASAWGSGKRVNNGAVNFSTDGQALEPIAAILKDKGVKTGLVSTATITHATPAGFAAAVKHRSDEEGIAPQYLSRVDIILGGGLPFFDGSSRKDQRDLLGEYAAAGYGVVRSRKALLETQEGKLLGLFSRGHLPYTVDRNHDQATATAVPTLAEMTSAALARLLPGDTPFLLQVEGARIDHAAHLNDIAGVLWDQLAFDDAIAMVRSLIDGRDDILLVVTSDHGNANPGMNGMGSGYTGSNAAFSKILNIKSSHEKLFAEWRKRNSNSPGEIIPLVREQLGFSLTAKQAETLIASFAKQPIIEWNEQLSNPEGLLGQFAGNHTGVGWTGTTHTSDPTIVTALGPQSRRFAGMVRNTDVFAHLVEMLG